MKALLDTHVLIGWGSDPTKISAEARAVIANGSNLMFISAATFWEISVKMKIGKLQIDEEIEETILRNNFRTLSITPQHAFFAGQLPLHHRDPFDRIIVAQALTEDLILITRDPRQIAYGGKVILA